jgi:MerR family transcriptional regulator, redox-sensitive transcriptional activator SoxR
MDPQAPLTSSAVGIGEAARRVGLAPSAIRYYESEGLIDPPRRHDGRRRYRPEDLRRLAFLAIGRELGLGLAALKAALRPGEAGWAGLVDEQLALLDARIAQAEQARGILLASRDCPTREPVRDCPRFRAALDAMLDAGDGRVASPLRAR